MSTDAVPARNGTAPELSPPTPLMPSERFGAAEAPDNPSHAPSTSDMSDTSEAPADTRDAAELGLGEIIREDFRRHYSSFAHPGLHVLAVYRLGRWRLTRRGPLRTIATVVYKVVNNLVIRNLYGVELSDKARVGRRVHIGHHQTILIPPYCEIGDDCTLRHNLTIGYAYGSAEPGDAPKIGARVEIAPGVQLIGRITIGDDVRIGPGSIVMSDVPAGATVFAAPARVMRPASR
ncbi:Serine acetyltransferase [Frankia canadensis]|uniref:Serine acetyltransferase n=1 Tax=Frankia canadensis TaxID=1836972 RepID=A0A2I2L137_9ACTN|nr:serine acetyltransferase [Frankia canadensis]SNQ51615.1 Serine acetyltransferase [Frankia canadensis]SOU58905.1 Serine acetyltransferase [Frankia canadensis]